MADKVNPEVAKAPLAAPKAAAAATVPEIAQPPVRPCGVLRTLDENARLELLKSVMTTAAVLESIGKRHIAQPKAKPEKKREMIGVPEKIKPEERQILDETYTEVPELKEYEEEQNKQRHTDPYLLDTTVFAPQSRQAFSKFIDTEYYGTFHLQKQAAALDEDACSKLGKSMEAGVESFLYQKFIREYMRNNSPYRGILVYHGLGSGKTCSSIAAAESLYGISNKKIIIMTPSSLRNNYIDEITFCGFKHYNKNNHWVAFELEPGYNSLYLYARHVLSLPEEHLEKVLKRSAERHVIWIADFKQEPNYADLSQQERDDIREQILASIHSRITFINYNGINSEELKKMACDPAGSIFDNSVIVIDEIHNLTRLMHNRLTPYMVARAATGRKRGEKNPDRAIQIEPVVPGRWVPSACGNEGKYKRAYLFYRLLSDARNSKIIGLSGTPIINFPDELGILSNMLGGYIECAKAIVGTLDKSVLKKIQEIAQKEPRIDIIHFNQKDKSNEMLLSAFPEGYEKVYSNDGEVEGIRHNSEAQEDIRTIYARLKQVFDTQGLPVSAVEFVSYSRLPVDSDEFKKEFVNEDLSVANALVLKKRLTGLISYYAGSKEEYMPRVLQDTEVRCEMSDYMLSKYVEARTKEIEGEVEQSKKKGQEKTDIYSIVEKFAKMSNPASYRFRSRAYCNFTFPKGMKRPFPTTAKTFEKVDLVKQKDDQDIAEDVKEKEGKEEEQAESDLEEEAESDLEEEAESDLEEEDESDLEEEEQYETNNDDEPEEPEESKQAGGDGSPEDPAVPKVVEPAPVGVASAPIAPAPIAPAPIAPAPVVAAPAPEAAAKSKLKLGSVKLIGKPVTAAPASDASATSAPATAAPAAAPKGVSKSKAKSAAKDVAAVPVVAVAASAVPAVAAAAPKGLSKTTSKVKSAASATAAPTIVPATVEPDIAAPATEAKEVVPMTKIVHQTVAPTAAAAADTAVETAAAAATAIKEKLVKKERVQNYKEDIERVKEKLDDKREEYLVLSNSKTRAHQLKTYSSKMDAMLRNIETSPGSNLVYSQFKAVEGLGVFGIVLKANGYAEIKLAGSEANPELSAETIASLQLPLDQQQKRFIMYSGDESPKRRGIILNIFNGNLDKLPENIRMYLEPFANEGNTKGDICWVIGITGAGAEGISLKCCRTVHIMEPYWNNVRLEQVKGRAIRICSHKDLPYAERTVNIFSYYSVFSKAQLTDEKLLPYTIRNSDKNETSDQFIYNISKRKDKINNAFLTIMKETAVDCNLNKNDNKGIACMNIVGDMKSYTFHPDLQVDKTLTYMEFKQEKQEDVKPGEAIKLKFIATARGRFIIYPKKDNTTPNEVYNMYSENTPDERQLPGDLYHRAIVAGQIKPIGLFTKTPFGDKSIQMI